MARPLEWLNGAEKAFYIAKKDAKVYYFKAPNFTYGLLVPVSLFLAFAFAGQTDLGIIIPGLTSLVVLFGTTSIEAVSVVLERQTGTINRLLAAPVSLFTIILGKALAGFLYGVILAIVVIIPMCLISGEAIAHPLFAFIAIGMSSMTFSAMGTVVSASAKWVPEAQMISNFLRFPMAFLSGAFMPLEQMAPQLIVVARFLPLTYAIESLRVAMVTPFNVPLYLLGLLAMALFTLAFLVLATKILKKKIMR